MRYHDPTGLDASETAMECSVALLAGASSVIVGTITKIAAAAPEPLITKAGAAAGYRYTISLGLLSASFGWDCIKGLALEPKYEACVQTQDREACEDAWLLCLYYVTAIPEGFDGEVEAMCGEVARTLHMLSEASPYRPDSCQDRTPCPVSIPGAVK
jgi:hypothetical protein